MFRIWVKNFVGEELVGSSVSCRSYARKGNAERAAKRMYANREDRKVRYEWIVSDKNPWLEEK